MMNSPVVRRLASVLGAFAIALAATAPAAEQPVVTVLTDFEDDSVVGRIVGVAKLTAADCSLKPGTIPARGQRSLEVLLGATVAEASLAAGLRFRLETPFEQADRVAAYLWITEHKVEVFYRIKDAAGRLFETRPVLLDTHNRWVRVAADLKPDLLKPLDEDAARPLAYPIEVDGFRLVARSPGRQRIFVDDLQVEHRVEAAQTVRGRFLFDKPTHLYAPGDRVQAGVELENTSRSQALTLAVELSWLRADGTEFKKDRSTVNLPASGVDYRARQPVDFSQTISEPGMYRLVARVREARWAASAMFETSIAVTPSNRNLPRGRETFFGVRANLLREPLEDQRLELELLNELGIQLLVLEAPWTQLEPTQDRFDFAALDDILKRLGDLDIDVVVALSEPPDWLPEESAARHARQSAVLTALAKQFGQRIGRLMPLSEPIEPAALGELAAALKAADFAGELWPPPVPLASAPQPAAGGASRLLESVGPLDAALRASRSLTGWTPADRWQHLADPLDGIGPLDDGVDALRFVVRAAETGLAGVIWHDLRDDTGDPRRVAQMHGLVRRDFSPKATLFGFSSAIGMLNGQRYIGPTPGTPEQFESALFMSPKRQVALFLPRPNRLLPGALAPITGAPGPLSVFDFERRTLPLVDSGAGPLVLSVPRPFYVVFDADRSQEAASLQVAPPWLRVPAELLLAEQGRLTVQIQAPRAASRSSIRIEIPPEAEVTSSVDTQALKLAAGEARQIDVELQRRKPAAGPFTLKVEMNFEGQRFTLPVRVSAPLGLPAISAAAELAASSVVAVRLYESGATKPPGDPSVLPAVRIGRAGGVVWIGIEAPAELVAGSSLQIGLAGGSSSRPRVVQVEDPWGKPGLTFVTGDPGGPPPPIELLPATGTHRAICAVALPLPADALRGADPAAPAGDAAFKVDVSIHEPAPAAFLPPRVYRLGSGPRLADSSEGYQWLTPAGD